MKFEPEDVVMWKGKQRADCDCICSTGGFHVKHQAPALSETSASIPRACLGRKGTSLTPSYEVHIWDL